MKTESVKVVLCSIFLLAMGTAKGQLSIGIGQSTDNTYTKGEAAQFQYTQPSDTASSWLMQGYIDIGVALSTQLQLSLNTEYHKNTLIDKEQDVWQYGGSLDYKWELLDGNGIAKSMVNPTLSIKYSEDRVKEEDGMQYIFGATFFSASSSSMARNQMQHLITPGLYFPILDSLVGFNTNHSVGYAYTRQNGDPLAMFQYSAEIQIYFFAKSFKNWLNNHKALFILASYSGRGVSKNETSSDTEGLSKIGVGLDFSLLNVVNKINDQAKMDKNKFIIKYEWVSGADPLKGLADQSYKQLSLNLLIKI